MGKRLRLVIRDDGQGTEDTSEHQNGKPSRLGIGIPGMMARMQQFGGNIDIHSGPNGTSVHATMPLVDPLVRLLSQGLSYLVPSSGSGARRWLLRQDNESTSLTGRNRCTAKTSKCQKPTHGAGRTVTVMHRMLGTNPPASR